MGHLICYTFEHHRSATVDKMGPVLLWISQDCHFNSCIKKPAQFVKRLILIELPQWKLLTAAPSHDGRRDGRS